MSQIQIPGAPYPSALQYKRQLEVVQFNGRPVLIDQKPFVLARIRTKKPEQNGDGEPSDRIEHSVFLHPRYVPKSVPHEIVQRRGRLSGRTLYLLLDQEDPVTDSSGKQWDILNWKGAGADTDQPMVIDPNSTWKGAGPQLRSEAIERVWGGVAHSQGQDEFLDTFLIDAGTPFTPHISLNPFPDELDTVFVSRLWPEETYSQLVRAVPNTARLDADAELLVQLIDPTRLLEVDVKLLELQIKLAQKGKLLLFDGLVESNRYPDGTFTDAENITVHPVTAEFERSFRNARRLACQLTSSSVVILSKTHPDFDSEAFFADERNKIALLDQFDVKLREILQKQSEK
ncbi:hypothetical protein HZC07_00475 [Candidatus Micrarchaeota archaeon]|nr:hypothetical protein [Candidatus Micrarchaeota archaeon]